MGEFTFRVSPDRTQVACYKFIHDATVADASSQEPFAVLPIDVATQSFSVQGEQYILYSNYLSLRRHKNYHTYDDTFCEQLAIIQLKDAQKLLLWANTLCANLHFSHVPQLSSVKEAMQSMSVELENIGSSQLATVNGIGGRGGDGGGDDEQRQRTKTLHDAVFGVLKSILEAVSPESFTLGISNNSGFYYKCDDERACEQLTQLSKYLFAFVTFHTDVQEALSLTYGAHIVSGVLRIFATMYSQFDNLLFTTNTDIVMHDAIALFYDLATDRLTSMVYLNQQYDVAAHVRDLLNNISRRYPKLAQIRNKQDYSLFVQNHPEAENYFKENFGYLNLWPSVLSFYMSKEQRILFNIRNALASNRGIMQRNETNTPVTANSVVKLLTDAIENIQNSGQFERYDKHAFDVFLQSDVMQSLTEMYIKPSSGNNSEDNGEELEKNLFAQLYKHRV